MTATSLTLHELARRLLTSPRRLEALLAEDVRRGLVERDEHGGYRLTATAEEQHGFALRELVQP